MIHYDSRHLRFICRLDGSTLPAALVYTLPSVALTLVLHHFLHNENSKEYLDFVASFSVSLSWSAIFATLAILLGLRANKAYDRFWEGITLVQQMRAEWFEAASNLMAFSIVAAKQDPDKKDQVSNFQMVLVRLMSLMHGAALCQIGGNKEDFEVLDIHALDLESLGYLAECEHNDVNRVEVLLHWIQVLVTDGVTKQVLVVAAPILTRAYQTLSRGMVNMHNARKLADVPFPFALNQVIIVLLLLQCLLTPFVVASALSNALTAVGVAFVPLFGMWSVTFVCGEIEQPFGSDPNDLPLSVLQYDFNMTLLMLIDKQAQRAPSLTVETSLDTQELRRTLEKKPLSLTSVRRSMMQHTSSTASYKHMNFTQRISSAFQQSSMSSGGFLKAFGSFSSSGEASLTRSWTHQSMLERRKAKRKEGLNSSSSLFSDRTSTGWSVVVDPLATDRSSTPTGTPKRLNLSGVEKSEDSNVADQPEQQLKQAGEALSVLDLHPRPPVDDVHHSSARGSSNRHGSTRNTVLDSIAENANREISADACSSCGSDLAPTSPDQSASNLKEAQCSSLSATSATKSSLNKTRPRTPRLASPMTSPRESETEMRHGVL